MDVPIALALIVMGVGIAGVWTWDIFTGERVDLSRGAFSARDPDSRSLLWPHWLAEYGTALGLIGSGAALLVGAEWSPVLAAAAAGSLLYTSVNSLGWALADRDRSVYAIPMVIGALVAVSALTYLLVR